MEGNQGTGGQPLTVSRRIWKNSVIGLHAVGTVVYLFALIYQEIINDRRDPRSTYIGDFKYLTYWNLVFQFVFSALSLCADLIKRRRINDKLTEFVDNFFFCVAFPFSAFVCVAFWALHLSDSTSVRNPNLTNRFPEWYNHVTHTLNGAMMILELVFVHHSERDRASSLLVLLVLCTMYVFLVYAIGTYNQVWIYPFLGRLCWSQRILFAVIGALKLVSNYVVCVYLSHLLWPNSRIQAFHQLFSSD